MTATSEGMSGTQDESGPIAIRSSPGGATATALAAGDPFEATADADPVDRRPPLILGQPGVGVWGLNNPVGWAFDITNFVFWVGIGHAGTLISAILFLFRQKWRTSINRFAEAMTIFAVMCA
jgi:hypothetical protein